ncbi:MAG TPA: hypothetical protein PKG77_19535 [Phycisphaerae bacterium]|nr:hypothetical protein [Phycisphaerae bacterium]HQL75971.1 hypothetical protein [Phycisphaerae bacterium]
MAGVDPGPRTLRELAWMAQARQRAAWERTSWLLALIANVNRDPRRQSRPLKPADFDPYAGQDGGRRERPLTDTRAAFRLMKMLFVKDDASDAHRGDQKGS